MSDARPTKDVDVRSFRWPERDGKGGDFGIFRNTIADRRCLETPVGGGGKMAAMV